MYYPDLTVLTAYQNQPILSRYRKDYPQANMSAEDALIELMKFIWLCLKHKSDQKNYPHESLLHFSCVVHPEMKDIDNMWHTFLLFTRDYHQFCKDYLGGCFFHHHPISDTTEIETDKIYEQELTRYLSYIYDNLGEKTLRKWFQCSYP